MSKALGFVISVFLLLVASNILLNAAAQLVMPGSASFAAELPSMNVKGLFTSDGSGLSDVTQGYGHTPYSGRYPNGWHDGIDLAATYGTPIYSPNAGTVVATGDQDNFCYRKGFGKYVAVKDSAHDLVLWYAHLGAIDVVPGQNVTRGAVLGTVGATGYETGVHLHFAIFGASGFTMTPRDGCGPEPTGQDENPLNYLGSVYN